MDKSIINLYAWITPLGLGIQKIGCFLNGCCFGKPSDLPWSVQYARCTNAHYYHWINGLIDENALFSLRVHPVQLYEVFLLFMAIAGSLVLILLGKSSRPVFRNLPESGPSLRILVLFVLSVSALIYVFRNLFTSFELFSLNIRYIPAILLTAYYVFRSIKMASFRLTTTAFFIIPLFLAAQTFSPDSTESKSVREFYNEVKSYRRIDLNTSFGEYYNNVSYNPHEGYCGTAYTDDAYKYHYRLAGAGFSIVKNGEEFITTQGINLYGGINKENNITKNWEKTDFIFGVNPYYKYDGKWVGVGVGAHIGNIRWVPLSPINKLTFDRGTRFSPILPEVLIRIGPKDIIDLQYNYGFNHPASIPVLSHELSIGKGFGFADGYNLRFGAAVLKNYSTIFISAEALLGKNYGLAMKYNFGGADFYNYNSDNFDNQYFDRKGRILFGLNYRFGFIK